MLAEDPELQNGYNAIGFSQVNCELSIFISSVEKHASIDGEDDWQISKSQDKNWQR